MSEIGLSLAALTVVLSFSVLFTQAMGGYLVIYLNTGFRYKSLTIKPVFRKISLPPIVFFK